MVEVEEEPPKLNGLDGEDPEANGHQEFFIEPEPIRAALISVDIMETLDSYTPGTIGEWRQ